MTPAPKPEPKPKQARKRLRNRGGKYGPDWPAVRDQVLAHAGGRCQIPDCGRKTKQVHHIINWAIVRCHELWNLIALCDAHHKWYGDRPGDRGFLFDLVGTPAELRKWRYERKVA